MKAIFFENNCISHLWPTSIVPRSGTTADWNVQR